MKIVIGEEASKIRNNYVRVFVDDSSKSYEEQISKLHTYVDGECYVGYLWDYLKNASNILEQDAIKMLSIVDSKVYVMWDVHSKEHILIPNYWKYPKKAILLIDPNELLMCLDTLPEDIYCFDGTFTWTIALTHEYIDSVRYCRFVPRTT